MPEKPWPSERRHSPAIVDVDRGPVREGLRDRLVRRAIVVFEIRERLVGEDDAPAERHACGVALEDGDVGVGTRLLVEEREVEARGSAADANDLHLTVESVPCVANRGDGRDPSAVSAYSGTEGPHDAGR